MRQLFILFFSLPLLLTAQNSLDGKVFDKALNEPLTGANILIENSFYGAYTDADGEFSFTRISTNNIKLIVSYIGYKTDTIPIDLSKDSEIVIYLDPLSYHTDEVIVLSTRAGTDNSSATTNVSKEEIVENNLGQDIPFLLQMTPSVVTTSDAGAGIGYTGIRIRGSDPSRINVTVNGIPINDSESHGVFWVNMPDLASSLENVEIQRGLGTSTNGAGAFGASINLQTSNFKPKPFGEINNSFGSFNTRKHTVMAGSGLINNHFNFEARLSSIHSDGYIDRASSDLNSYYVSGSYVGEKTVIKALSFGGKEITYQSWYGTPEARITGNIAALETHISNEVYPDPVANNLRNSDRRYNHYLYENQVDNYEQYHYQLHFSHQVSAKTTANLSLHYTRGKGYFEEHRLDEDLQDYRIPPIRLGPNVVSSTDLIRRRWLDNHFYGFTYSILHEVNKKLKFNLGGAANRYEGDHFGEVIWARFASSSFPGRPYYFNIGEKIDANTYLKANYQATEKLSLFADLQYRFISYRTDGTDNDQRRFDIDESYNFFNPKLGANYAINKSTNVSFLAARGGREPNRADLVDQDTLANKAETMTNIELGVQSKKERYFWSINFYMMEYQNQLVNTGQLNDVGSPIRENIDDSYRRGIEVTAGYYFNKYLKYQANATFSRNKIKRFTERLDVYEFERENTDLSFSPSVIFNSELVITPFKPLEIGLQTRYIGEQYLDNTMHANRKLDAYFVSDLRVEYKVKTKLFKEVRLMGRINNVFNELYSANGYTYSYIYGDLITENFFYPQATRNYLVGLNVKF